MSKNKEICEKHKPKKKQSWLHQHKMTVLLMVTALILTLIAPVLIAIDWENNKMTVAALSPIIALAFAPIIALVVQKKSL